MPSTKNKIGLKFDGLEEMIVKLESIEGDLKSTTEKALKASKQRVNEELRKVTIPTNFPAHGKYSTGKTAQSIDTDMSVTWEGTTASIKVGYDMQISGMTSIFLMYGTPRHKPPMKAVRKMYNAIYGARMKKEVAEIQREVFVKVIKRRMGG